MVLGLRKQPAAVDIDELFLQLEKQRATGETPAALAKKPSFWDELRMEPEAPPNCDVSTIHTRYPITPEERMYLFKKNVWCLFTITFVSAMEGTLSNPSLFLYTVSLGGDARTYGRLGAIFWLFRCLSLVGFGAYSDRLPFKTTMSFGLWCGMLGGVLYAMAPLAVATFGYGGIATLYLGRIMTGIGSGMSVPSSAFFATQTPISERSTYVGYNQSLGRMVTPSGPALNLLFIALPAFSPWFFPNGAGHCGDDPDSPEAHCMFSQYSYVGWFIFCTNSLNLYLLRQRFIEPPRPGVGIIPGTKPQLPSLRWTLHHLRRTRAWVSYVLSMQNNYNSQVVGFAIPIVSNHNFGWGQLENSMLTAVTAPLGIFSTTFTGRLPRKGFKDRNCICVAQLFIGPGLFAMMLLWGCLDKESAGSEWSDYSPDSPDEPRLHSLLGFVALTCYYQLTFPAQVCTFICVCCNYSVFCCRSTAKVLTTPFYSMP